MAFGAEELLCSGVGHIWVSEHVGAGIDRKEQGPSEGAEGGALAVLELAM